jgi:hypothetical protein
MALGLYPQYKRSKICRHLQLSGGQFKQRLDNDRDLPANHGFVLAVKEIISGLDDFDIASPSYQSMTEV